MKKTDIITWITDTCKWDSVLTNTAISAHEILDSWDQFLQERPLQPKRAIRKYFREKGWNTPHDYETLAEAMMSWEEFILNSEHPQEYDWISGLAESYRVNPREIIEFRKTMSWEELSSLPEIPYNMNSLEKKETVFEILLRIWFISEKEIFNALMRIDERNFQDYADKLWLNLEGVLLEQSFSISEYIEGINHIVIWDADIDWRYYIISTFTKIKDGNKTEYLDVIIVNENWIIFDNWWFSSQNGDKKITQIKDRRIFNHNTLICEYEWIRKLLKFDAKHFPIVELHTAFEDGKTYDLQYHRCRDQSSGNKLFILDRDTEKWEIETTFFRWVTWPEWIVVSTTMYYPGSWKKVKFSLFDYEEASFDTHHDYIFTEIMSRKRSVNFKDMWYSDDKTNLLGLNGHIAISSFFKADLFVWIKGSWLEEMFPDEVLSMIRKISDSTGIPYQFDIRVISDWKRCFVKRTTPVEIIIKDYEKIKTD